MAIVVVLVHDEQVVVSTRIVVRGALGLVGSWFGPDGLVELVEYIEKRRVVKKRVDPVGLASCVSAVLSWGRRTVDA